MEILNIWKLQHQSVDHDYYPYLLQLDDNRIIHLSINRNYEVLVVYSKEIKDVDILREIYFNMVKSKKCVDRLKFVFFHPNNIVFFPTKIRN